ncbi:hypothetical protein PIB30_111411, partial [Stylosanthes scabra]|nr:hypothetical protein [Stylosanthes scabra]
EVSTHMRELPRICVEALYETWDWRNVAHVIRERLTYNVGSLELWLLESRYTWRSHV